MPDIPDHEIARQIDAIADEFEANWLPDSPNDIGCYLDRIAEEHRERLLKSLVEVDFELRRKSDQTIDLDGYRKFGDQAVNWVRELLAETRQQAATIPPKKQTGSLSQKPTKGDLVRYFGEYELLEEIARGGMGVVFKARQVKLNRIVALKMILSGELAGDEEVQRFNTEAEAAANLDHPGIVPVYEIGEHEGQHFFSMGFIDGQSLADRVKDGPLPPREAAEIVKKIAEAVAYAHERGVIHRDLKPANVLLDPNGEPKVTDFGLAKQVESDRDLTRTGAVMGTPSYMPPEQASGRIDEVGPQADVYSLGAILYCMLTGRPPFQSANPMDVLKQVLEKEPVALRQLDRSIPRDLETICLKCLAKDASRRFDSSASFAEDLACYLNGEPILARPVGRLEKTWLWAKRNPVVVGTACTILLTIIVAAGLIFESRRQNQNRRLATAVAALKAAPTDAVPYALRTLDEFPSANVLAILRKEFDTTERSTDALDQQKLNLSYGLAHFGQIEFDVVIAGLISDDTDPDEVDNVVQSLMESKTESLTALKTAAQQASQAANWSKKARFAIVALHLGDESLAAEMLRDQPQETKPVVELPDLPDNFRKQINQVNSLPEEQKALPRSRLKLAVAHYYLDQNEEALEELQQLAGGEPFNSEVWLRQAICQARTGRSEDASNSRRQLSWATRKKSLIAYADILIQASLGNLDAASDQLNELISGDSKNATSQYNAACIAAQLAKICRAKKLTDETKFKQLTLRLLRTAYIDLGYNGSSGITNDPDLIPMHQDLDFRALVSELKPFLVTWDPVQRTVFIQEFVNWSGTLDSLANLVSETENPALRSGICLAIGGVNKPGQIAKVAWEPILANWYTESTDNGTHGAASWALSQWNLDLPKIAEAKTPASNRDWWHAIAGLRFAKITGGSVVGEQGPIVVKEDYWMSDSEITVGLFKQFMTDQEYHGKHPDMKPVDWKGVEVFDNDESPDLPVQRVSWYEAVMFCNWLSWKQDLAPCYEIKKSPPPKRDVGQPQQATKNSSGNSVRSLPYQVKWLPAANGIRLPTESEWEYACRGGTTTIWSFGDQESLLAEYGWFYLNSSSRTTHPTGTRKCNAWGLFDMHGNVDEWCWGEGSNRLVLGGNWGSNAGYCQSSSGFRIVPAFRNSTLGFRVARGPSSPASPASE